MQSISVKVLLRTNKPLANGEYPIMLRIIKDRETNFIKIGTCKKELWDFENGIPKEKSIV